jgi:hypothetical protein
MNKSETNHVREFLSLKCAGQMLNLGLFPNSAAKEVTESVGMFRAVADHLLDDTITLKNPDIHLVVVGDGNTPRTAAMFAMRSGWNCHSIDPILNTNKDWNSIKRLLIHSLKVEQCNLHFGDYPLIIVLPHSHAKMEDILQHIKGNNRYIVSMPCCVPHDIPGKEYIGYVDQAVWSEKNTIKIWKNV